MAVRSGSLQRKEQTISTKDLAANVSGVLGRVREAGHVVVTEDGEPAMILLTPDEFRGLQYRQHVVEAIERGLASAEAGRLVEDDDLTREFDDLYGPLA
jgi:antitoxin (DNA-binding transcriptional repressor) of toxin-antitoxin stability system